MRRARHSSIRWAAAAAMCVVACASAPSPAAQIASSLVSAPPPPEIGQDYAVVSFKIDPQDGEVCSVEYGTSAMYRASAPCDPQPSGTTPMIVSARLSGLSPATTYHYRLRLATQNGTVFGADSTFTTLADASPPPPPPPPPPSPPTISSLAIAALARPDSTGQAVVNPNGSSTQCFFEDVASAVRSPCTPQPGDGTDPVTVTGSVPVHGALVGFRVVATNAGGTITSDPTSLMVEWLDPPGVGTTKIVATRRGKSGAIAVDLACSGQLRDVCRGTLALSARARLHGRRRTIELGHAAYDLTAPNRATIAMPLSKRGRRLLARHPRVQPHASLQPASASP